MTSALLSILVVFYSLLFTPLKLLLSFLALGNGKLKTQLTGRLDVYGEALSLARERAQKNRCVLFFCSSAGEFEQARPLIERLEQNGNVYVYVLFFSCAGLDYIKARGDRVRANLAPATDSTFQWGRLFSALRPDLICVVRHELWPGFLLTARQFGRLVLIDASQSLGEAKSPLKRLFRRFLLDLFHRIYTVSLEDSQFFAKAYLISAQKLLAVGDTKYDRVRERARERIAEIDSLKAALDGLAPVRDKQRLVLGSVYKEEIELFLAAHDLSADIAANWQVIIAPHHVSEDMVGFILRALDSAGLRAVRFSQIPASSSIIVLDTMGKLAEIYGTADAAFIGGSLKRKVHNVLEPASHGLALAYGPFYKNSQEAQHLVRSGLAKVIVDPPAFAVWWRSLETDGAGAKARMRAAVQELSGASDRIVKEWMSVLGSE